ncbi:MAG: hypothetical protein KBE23_24855 [Chloroflexi bacterium]|nr:hypothetical protein [Chloroflexota bacterium]MBP7045997.1 hypothetical protein [Chloroflexota bacterium]
MAHDWRWKIDEALKRIQERYAYVGSKTGASLLAVVYPPEVETAVFHEWSAQTARLGPQYDLQTVDVLSITVQTVAKLGSDHIVASIANPMPGSNPEAALGKMWVTAVTRQIHTYLDNSPKERPVVVLQNVAALYPATTPRNLLQNLWDNPKPLRGPVIILIPGQLIESRVYKFLNKETELMYRGDII